MTGGDSWMIRQVSPKPLQLKGARDTEAQTGWRIRGDARMKANVLERKQGSGYTAVASFLVKVGECSPAAAPLPEPPPPPEPAVQAPKPAVRPLDQSKPPSRPPALKKK